MADCTQLSCCPFAIDRVEHLTSQELPAGGAFTSQADISIPEGLTKLSFWISYTRGAVGGYPQFQVEWSNGTETDYVEMILDEGSLSASQPNASVQLYRQRLLGPIPQDGNALTYIFPFDVPLWATGVRLLAAELGVTATPGTIAIAATGEGSI